MIWCPTVSTGAFVARRNGKVFITGNSGFPKSLDVSKAIDKAAGAEGEYRDAKTKAHAGRKTLNVPEGWDRPWMADPEAMNRANSVYHPATDAARQWQGWGTALKPALEPITMARKPLVGTVAENVLAHGTGALNIDGCRVGTSGSRTNSSQPNALRVGVASGMTQGTETVVRDAGRWPANLILSIPEDEYYLRDDVTPDQLRQLAEWMDANP